MPFLIINKKIMNKNKITKRVFVIIMLSVLFFSFKKKIHDPSYANTTLTEQVDGFWVLQIHSALTAFEHEVHTNYGKDSYKTPNEFNTLVIEHLKKNIFVKMNGKHSVILENVYVKLGHETKAVFEVVGVPKKVAIVLFTNSSFNDVYNNQNTLIILKKGFEKQRFLLNNKNNYTVELKVSGNQLLQQ